MAVGRNMVVFDDGSKKSVTHAHKSLNLPFRCLDVKAAVPIDNMWMLQCSQKTKQLYATIIIYDREYPHLKTSLLQKLAKEK